MIRNLAIALLGSVVILGCSKKNGDSPSLNTISINGTAYATVAVGTQTWMSQNYNGPGGTNYDTDPNSPVFGKLYTFTEAQAITLPTGWHLPTRSDFNTLFTSIGGPALVGANGLPISIARKLMSKTTWNFALGTDSIGFDVVATGVYQVNSVTPSHYLNKGFITGFYTSDLYYPRLNIPFVFMVTENPFYFPTGFTGVDFGAQDRVAIRFVKDN